MKSRKFGMVAESMNIIDTFFVKIKDPVSAGFFYAQNRLDRKVRIATSTESPISDE
jgi:hypothetical protein